MGLPWLTPREVVQWKEVLKQCSASEFVRRKGKKTRHFQLLHLEICMMHGRTARGKELAAFYSFV
jgi:hypothetical protein